MSNSKYFSDEIVKRFRSVIKERAFSNHLCEDNLPQLYKYIKETASCVKQRLEISCQSDQVDPSDEENQQLFDELEDFLQIILAIAEARGKNYIEHTKLPENVLADTYSFLSGLDRAFEDDSTLIKLALSENDFYGAADLLHYIADLERAADENSLLVVKAEELAEAITGSARTKKLKGKFSERLRDIEEVSLDLPMR